MTAAVQSESVAAACPADLDPEAVATALRSVPGFTDLPAAALGGSGAVGLSHDHVRIDRLAPDGTPVLLRLPRLSQLGLAPEPALARQAEAFRRLAPSRATPRLLAVLPVGPALPGGGLLVEDVTPGPDGRRTGRLPADTTDLAALADCLAAIHALPRPPGPARPPLPDQSDLVAGPLAAIREQMAFLEAPEAGVAAAAVAAIRAEAARVDAFCRDRRRIDAPRTVLTDTHPGNFIVRTEAGGATVARFVDLEKVAYGSPAADLAHATLPPSAGWDPRCGIAVTREDVAAVYQHYLSALAAPERTALLPWLMPMRRLIWLRTTTFFAKWRVLRRRDAAWSHRLLPAAVADHLDRHTRTWLDPDRIAALRAEWLDGGL